MKTYVVLFILLTLAACHRDDPPAVPDAGQARQLDEAEAMLNDSAADDANAAGR